MTQQNIHTMQDILDALEKNPDLQREFHKHLVSAVRSDSELREELRKEILTEELLQLPARFTRLEETVEEIKQDVTELKQDMVEVKDRLTTLEEKLDRMETRQNRMSGKLDDLIGSNYESKAIEASRRMIRTELNMRKATVLYTGSERIWKEFEHDILTPALDEYRIEPDQFDDLKASDCIIQCENPDGQIIYAVVETSITVQKHDRERAVRRAGIMEQATGIPTIPYVAGTKQDPPESGESPVRFLEYQWDQENRQD